MRILVTGTAGFIGFHLARALLAKGHRVAGLDGMTSYYDIALKDARNRILEGTPGFTFHRHMLEDMAALESAVEKIEPEIIVHLAAQAGVRYSLENPRAYVESNLVGTFNLLEVARRIGPKHFLTASTSSVYGANTSMPFRETDRTDHQLTLYAATKKGTENMAHSYAHLWKFPVTALRFFTVYGPWGRPDMAPQKFVQRGLAGEAIDVYNRGRMKRDFTYIDDVIEAVMRLIDCVPGEGKPVCDFDSLSPVAPYRVVNIGGGNVVDLSEFIAEIERAIGKPLKKNMLEMQKGDVTATEASPALLERLTGFTPSIPISRGVPELVEWYRGFYAA